MNESLISQVQELGLSEKEARVYVANLMLGPTPVQRIADFSGVKRVTAYVILESLVNLGLASQTTKGKKTLFNAEDPVSLKRLLAKKEEELADQKAHFEGILPELKQLKAMPTDSPEVKLYDSAEGIRTLVSGFFNSSTTKVDVVYGISNIDQVDTFFPEFKANMSNPIRLHSGVRSQFVYTSQDGPILRETDAQRNRKSRFLPYDKYPLNADFSIVGDYVVMLALTGRPMGITIKSHELAKGMKAIFEALWVAAEPYN